MAAGCRDGPYPARLAMKRKTTSPLKELKKIERRGTQRNWAFLFYGSILLVIAAIVTLEVIGYLKGHR